MKTFALLFLIAVSAPAATVDDMAWLAGHWTGKGLGGDCTETWSPPHNGVMLGTFRLVKEGKPVFYEFLTLEVVDGTLVMRIKHFNSDLKGWEEKDKFLEFKHTKTAENVIEFDALRFVREGNDAMKIYLRMRGKDGSTREELFEFRRAA